MRRVALFAFSGEEMCFVHVLLNALAYHGAGYEVRLVLEGASTGLLGSLGDGTSPLASLFGRCREAGIVAGACRACAKKLGTHEVAQAMGLPLLDDMNGHAGMAPFSTLGYEIITF